MAKAASDNPNVGRRRSARHATTSENTMDEVVNVSDEKKKRPSKTSGVAAAAAAATTKRGLTLDSPSTSATIPRRSKRVKIEKEPPENDENVKIEEGKAAESPGRKRIKLEDEELSSALSSPLSSPVKAELDKEEEDDDDDGDYASTSKTAAPKKTKAKTKSPTKQKTKQKTKSTKSAVESAVAAADLLQSKKLKSYTQFAAARQSPYPNFAHPTASEAKLAHRILASLHGERVQAPGAVVAPKSRSGCGDSPSVLDALIRTILSQNTSDANSSRAKLAMDAVYGSPTNSTTKEKDSAADSAYTAIVTGGQEKLAKTIESGGLAVVKSKVIISILQQTKEKYGRYSLDHLFHTSNEDAMKEMLSFKGVGPKTASCVLLFCLRRPSFAVDTHVHRITGTLGWRPAAANRDQTHAHLDARIPDEDKYGLHVLLIKHGKVCAECKAGGKSLGRCELRKAFGKGKGKGKGKGEGLEVKGEEEESVGDDGVVKDEEDDARDIKSEGNGGEDIKV